MLAERACASSGDWLSAAVSEAWHQPYISVTPINHRFPCDVLLDNNMSAFILVLDTRKRNFLQNWRW